MKKKTLAVLAGLLFAGLIHAQAVTYTVVQTGAWEDALNWDQATAPLNDPTAKINSKTGKTITLTGTAMIGYLALNDGDTSNLSVVIDGGALHSDMVNWNAVGYNKSASMLITNGGSWTCNGRVDIGLFDEVDGQINIFTMAADSGDVTVFGNFNLGTSFDGSHTVTTRAYIHGGTLDVGGNFSIAATGDNILDISNNAEIIIDGDEVTILQSYVLDGKVTAYGGTGTPIIDYNASYPGKTTIKAYAGQLTGNWQVADSQYTTNEMIVTPFDAFDDFGIIGDGVTDVTDEIQEALVLIANLGGGSLFLPDGFYKIGGNLTIPAAVTLRGDWQKPVAGQSIVGTVLMAYAGRDNESAPYFITLNESAGVNGVSIWYPEQLPTDIRPYPITIGNGCGATMENVTFVNAYFGFSSYLEGTAGRPLVRNIYGTPLKTGIEFDSISDIGRIETVHFSPAYWAGSGLANAPTAGEHEAWIYNNGTGVIHGRMDWSYSCYVNVEGYNIGLALRPSRWDGKAPNGQSYDFHLTDCKTGLYIEDNLYNGTQFSRFTITGAETGVYMGPSCKETSMFHSFEIDATGSAFYCEGSTSRAMIMSTDFQNGAVQFEGGYLSVINSDFGNEGAHIVLGPDMQGATILGNRFAGTPKIINNTAYPVEIDHTAQNVAPMPAYDFKQPTQAYKPATTNFYVVTDAPFNAVADGVTDDTAAFTNALATAAAAGGGTVFVPGGNYRLDGTLTIPTGVELRGVFDIQHGTDVKGSLLNITSGHNEANGTPFIQLESDSGIKGLNFHYPNQIYDAGDTNWYGFVPYPFMVRGLGDDVYVVNISATIPYQLIDLATYKCDRHYIEYVFSTCLKTGVHVGGGSADGQLHNVQLNPNSYTFRYNEYESIPPGTPDALKDLLWREATPYLFGHMTNEVVHECFVYAGVRGIHLVEENGFGPSGHCLGFGADACTTAFLVDDVGSGGFEPINTQIVSTDPDIGHYFETTSNLTDTFRMFSGSAWGPHQYSAIIRGGDVELQNLLIQRDGLAGTYLIENGASVETYASSLDNLQNNTFLNISGGSAVKLAGNILNLDEINMPVTGGGITAIANVRFGAAASASTTSSWTDGGSGSDWNTAANWDNGVPNSTVQAIISGSSATVTSPADADTLIADSTLDVSAGTLAVVDWMVLGYDAGTAGTLNLNSGTVTVGSELVVGLNGLGTVNLQSGTLAVGSLAMDENSLLDITDGTLIIDGDVTAGINAYVASGWITALGGLYVPSVDYNTTNPGKTTVVAVERPTTITAWSPGAGSADWSTDASWTLGAAPLSPYQNLKVVFNVEGAQECVLNTSATVAQLVMADNGTYNGTFLKLSNGADLTAGLSAAGNKIWTGIGYTRDAQLTVEAGAVFTTANNLWIGFASPSIGTLNIDGGTVNVGGQIGLGWNTGTGFINLTSGTLNLDRMDSANSIKGSSVIDIEAGTITINGNYTNIVNNYYAAGRITAYGGNGTLNVDYDNLNAGKTTVTVTGPVTVPNVVGQDQASAESELVASNLTVGAVTTQYHATVPAGEVLNQSIAAGSSVAINTSVDLVVSLGVEMVTVPNVVGQAQASAENALVASNLTVGAVTTQYHATVPAGEVLSQSIAGGSSVAINTSVDLVVSLGLQQVTVPDVVGLLEAVAVSTLTDSNLTVGTISYESSETVASGDVISQSIIGGSSVAVGSPVNLTVSTGLPAFSTTVWNSMASTVWTNDANWSGAAAPLRNTQNLKVVFNVDGAVEAVLDTTAEVCQLVVGDNGTYNGANVRLASGAILTAGYNPEGGTVWTAVGYNRPATMIVESNAVFEAGADLLLGRFGSGTTNDYSSFLDVDGGIAIISGAIVMGNGAVGHEDSGGYIIVQNGGILQVGGALEVNNTQYGGSGIDLYSGAILLDGDQLNAVSNLVASGLLAGYGGIGAIVVDYDVSNTGKTTVWGALPSTNWTDLAFDDFELGWGNWVSGGIDARLSGNYALDSQCLDIQDNSGDASSAWLANSLDLTGYSELKIEFTYMPISMDNGTEDFWVQFSDNGGLTWTTVEAYVVDTDFTNGIRENPVIAIDSGSYGFTSDVKIRFQCDASGNQDDIYIDDVRIQAR